MHGSARRLSNAPSSVQGTPTQGSRLSLQEYGPHDARQRTSPGSSLSMGQRTSPGSFQRLAEVETWNVKEKEAECVWWQEASERQAKEIETAFGAEVRKTVDAMRADLNGLESRLRLTIEEERRERTASLSALRLELDA